MPLDTHELPQNWPTDLVYLQRPAHSAKLTVEQVTALREQCDSPLPIISLPRPPAVHVKIQPVRDPTHPACGQFGLFAAVHLAPDQLVLPYLGHVHSNNADDTDPNSDYDISLNREIGLSVDASSMGNEARMVNDYRGVPRRPEVVWGDGRKAKKGGKPGPNAEFRDVWLEHEDRTGELGIAIFVLRAAKSGKGKEGIRPGEEILVSYGKGFWSARQEGEVWQ